ncbi:MAG TPA: 16S rRNA (cytidine(1402)-2'-O)-methyltransferase [Firmicutes bacterium]|nr:16S rRNA (cytidine(1402)-2'-O)-methyltransferase [Bacillota bacterium]
MSLTKDPERLYADEFNADGTEKNKIRGGTLYLVTTPIGNLADLSERAKKVLSGVDFVAAEDTRNSAKLLAYFGIRKPLVSYFEHNKRERGEIIANRLAAGESCALVTDAGMPGISDPGEDLVKLCAERGIPVTAVPGPCAALSALTLSGLATSRFAFEGFLSTNRGERGRRLAELAGDTRTLIFYEAPHKLKTTLSDLYAAFGDRKISLCRELTKLNEEIVRVSLSEAVELYNDHEPRGEYVLIVEGASEQPKESEFAGMSVVEQVEYYISQGMTKMEAVKACARDRGVMKNEVYKAVVGIEADKGE